MFMAVEEYGHKSPTVYTAVSGNNSDIVECVAKLYLRPRDRIADVTYGRGVFWRQLDMEQYSFCASDLVTCPEAPYDFRKLPYADATFDVVALDPPYQHHGATVKLRRCYRNEITTANLNHDEIIQLYVDGMREARRILKPDGLLWVKCQDEIESGWQRWSHIEIYEAALELGFFGKDLFLLMQSQRPVIRAKNQQHARKNHSYLWIFKLRPPRRSRTTKQPGVCGTAEHRPT